VTNGNKLLSLQHEVIVEITDPNVMHATGSIAKGDRGLVWSYQQEFEQRQTVADLIQEQSPLRQTRSLQPILSRGGD